MIKNPLKFVFGAINDGFAVIKSEMRLDEALDLVRLHRDADEDNILIINNNGDSSKIVMGNYLAQ